MRLRPAVLKRHAQNAACEVMSQVTSSSLRRRPDAFGETSSWFLQELPVEPVSLLLRVSQKVQMLLHTLP